MSYYFDGPEIRPHDDQCEREDRVPRGLTCQCTFRFDVRSVDLEERPVHWPWLHGRAPEQSAEAS